MCTDDTFDTYESADDTSQGTYEAPDEGPAGEAKPGWNRRTFLKAAALGTAAAALLGRSSGDGGGLSFGAASALAHEDTKSACTAQDIEVLGGQIINEPCACAEGGTFQAIAKFTVINQNNATRKCITLHLGSGGLFGGKDFLLKDENGSSNISGHGTTKEMFANLGEVPCNFAQECYANSVIAFQTAKNQSDDACPEGGITKYPGGQCRRQTICITGFGVNVACAGNNCAATGAANAGTTCLTAPSCTVPCGSDLNLAVTAVGGTADCAATNPPTVTLTPPGGGTPLQPTSQSVLTDPTTGITRRTACFTVPAGSVQPGCYTVTAIDCSPEQCTRTAVINVAAGSITAGLAFSPANTACGNGQVTFTGSATDNATGAALSGCSFRFKVDNGDYVNGGGTNGNEFVFEPTVTGGALDTACHTVTVEANCSGCTDTESRTISQCVQSTVGPAGGAC